MIPAKPFVTVAIATCNYANLLGRALDSVFQQTYPANSSEIIVVDDGSTDATPLILEKYRGRIRTLRQENAGQAEAINSALKIAKGDLVCLLDPDDEWYPDKLERIAAEFQDPDVGMVQHGMDVKTSIAKTHFRLPQDLSSGWLRERALTAEFQCMPTSALSFRMTALKRLLPPPAELKTGGTDWYFSVLVALVSKISAIRQPLGAYWIHERNCFSSNATPASLRQQLLTIDTVRGSAKKAAFSLGMKIPEGFESALYSEYPVSCRMNLAWREKEIMKMPSYFWSYFSKYALPEYGWSLRLLRRSFRMAACAIFPPPLYEKLGFYRHG